MRAFARPVSAPPRTLLARVARWTAALALSGALAACHGGGSASSSAMDAPEMALGNPNAKVTVIEYASTTCPHCARFEEEVFPAFKAKYIDTGKVHYIFREYLTEMPQVGAAGFLLARCAGKDKYFQVLDALFRSQPELFNTGDAHGILLRIARSAGLSEAQFNACEQNEAALKALAQRVDKAVTVDHIDATPTFVVNGKPLTSGEKSLAELDAAIQPLLK